MCTSRTTRSLLGAFAVTAMVGSTHGQLVTAGDRNTMVNRTGTTARVTPGAMTPNRVTNGGYVQHENLPETIELTGLVRDFRERSEQGGHPDFERQPTNGFGHYAYMCADMLDEDGKPAYMSGGHLVTRNWKDSDGNQVAPPRDYLSPTLTQEGRIQSAEGGAVTSAESFAGWFRDSAYNRSQPLTLTLRRQSGSNVYTFDDKEDDTYRDLGGFFPINGELFGNSAGESKNFHFTFELDTRFVYRENTGQIFTFNGDDDVFVFVDNRVVIDIGGVHASVSQSINLDDLDWLQDGEEYSLKFFFAERHRTQSNFRIETNLNLRDAELPSVTDLYD